ncbi:MAG TPA: ATP-binding protein [Pyrinomonadaceae bacterium]
MPFKTTFINQALADHTCVSTPSSQKELSTHRILVVDDSPVSLRMMERVLDKKYEVLTAGNAFAGLEILRTNKISLLISDQRMSEMSGTELLRQSQLIDPDLVCMLVTANTDNDTSAEAINHAGALRVIHKPWDAEWVLHFVAEALEHRETLLECKYANSEIKKVMEDLRPTQANWAPAKTTPATEFINESPQIFLASSDASLTALFKGTDEINNRTILIDDSRKLIADLKVWNKSAIVLLNPHLSQQTIAQTCQQLRESCQPNPVYIIAIGTSEMNERISGVDDVLNVPINHSQLEACIARGEKFLAVGRELTDQKKVSQDIYEHLQSAVNTVTQLTGKLFKEIQERTRAEEELRLQRILLESQSEASLDGVLVVSVEGKIISHNQRFLDIWGLSEEMANSESGDSVLLAIAEMQNQPEEFLALVHHLRKHAEERSDREITLKNSRIIHYYNAPVKNADHVLYGRAYYFRDITERKLLENQLRQAQKLESVGQLAAGIAHEINTPTQYVSDNTRFLIDAFQDLLKVHDAYAELASSARAGTTTPTLLAEVDKSIKDADLEFLTEEIPKALTQSLEGTQRISKIVQSMKDFAHPGVAVKQACDLNRAIDSTITVACGEWKYVAHLITDFDPMLPLVPCLQGELNQVILNMIINASHAIADVVGDGSKGKGTITISTTLAPPWAEIRIRDTGTGIPEKYRSRIFDPFFTTKQVGKGTGQGLAISHNVIVEKHGGTISLESAEDTGTTFIIRLPLQETSTDDSYSDDQKNLICRR